MNYAKKTARMLLPDRLRTGIYADILYDMGMKRRFTIMFPVPLSLYARLAAPLKVRKNAAPARWRR